MVDIKSILHCLLLLQLNMPNVLKIDQTLHDFPCDQNIERLISLIIFSSQNHEKLLYQYQTSLYDSDYICATLVHCADRKSDVYPLE